MSSEIKAISLCSLGWAPRHAQPVAGVDVDGVIIGAVLSAIMRASAVAISRPMSAVEFAASVSLAGCALGSTVGARFVHVPRKHCVPSGQAMRAHSASGVQMPSSQAVPLGQLTALHGSRTQAPSVGSQMVVRMQRPPHGSSVHSPSRQVLPASQSRRVQLGMQSPSRQNSLGPHSTSRHRAGRQRPSTQACPSGHSTPRHSSAVQVPRRHASPSAQAASEQGSRHCPVSDSHTRPGWHG